jgi:hypothetical protein
MTGSPVCFAHIVERYHVRPECESCKLCAKWKCPHFERPDRLLSEHLDSEGICLLWVDGEAPKPNPTHARCKQCKAVTRIITLRHGLCRKCADGTKNKNRKLCPSCGELKHAPHFRRGVCRRCSGYHDKYIQDGRYGRKTGDICPKCGKPGEFYDRHYECIRCVNGRTIDRRRKERMELRGATV